MDEFFTARSEDDKVPAVKQAMVWVLALGVIIVVGFTVVWSPSVSERPEGVLPGSPAPSVSLPAIVGSVTATSRAPSGPRTLGPKLRLPGDTNHSKSPASHGVSQVATVLLGLVVAGPLMAFWGSPGRRRRRRRRGRRVAVDAGGALGGGTVEARSAVVARHLSRNAAVRRQLLAGEDPRTGVLRAWLDVQEAAEVSGFARHDSETSGEFTRRVLTRWDVDPESLAALSGAYREAQFSDHPISDETLSQVAAALQQVERAMGGPSVTTGER